MSDNTEDRYEEYEAYTRKKYIFIAAVVILALVGVAVCGYKILFKEIKETSEENKKIVDRVRKTFTEGLEQYYGLKQDDYTVTDRIGEGDGHPIYRFTVKGSGEYTATIGETSLCTDYCVGEYYAAAQERARALIDESKILPEGITYNFVETRCEFSGYQWYYAATHHCTPEQLPVWLNRDEIGNFREAAVKDRERWKSEVNTLLEISIDVPTDIKLTTEQFAAIREELALFTEELRVRLLQSEGGKAYKVYVYNPRKDTMSYDSYLAP